jgi:hypothetical protein
MCAVGFSQVAPEKPNPKLHQRSLSIFCRSSSPYSWLGGCCAGVAFHACKGRGVIHLYKWSLQDGELGARAEIDAHKVTNTLVWHAEEFGRHHSCTVHFDIVGISDPTLLKMTCNLACAASAASSCTCGCNYCRGA